MALITRFRTLSFLLALIALSGGAATPLRAELSPREQELANLLVNASDQNRPFMVLDPVLTQVARQRAADMAARDYFGHTNPDGKAANWLVYEAGYTLPSSYLASRDQNNIESIAAGRSSAAGTWSDWMGSSPHREHLLAQTPFYRDQTSYGIGCYHVPGSTYVDYWVVLTAPRAGPQLSISAPRNNARLTASSVTFEGASGGNPQAVHIEYRLENSSGIGTYQSASGVTAWTATVAGLLPGANTVHVRSLDANDTVLEEVRRNVHYALLRPLVVTVLGEGAVTSGFVGTSLREVGRDYTISAIAAPGWIFAGWSGALTGSDAAVSFVMSEGLALTASFIPNPFLFLRGAYNGLIGADGSNYERSGFLRLHVTGRGRITGRLLFAGGDYVLRSRFDQQGNAALTLERPGNTPLALMLHVDLAGNNDEITGSLTDGNVTISLAVAPSAKGDETSPHAGQYTLRFPDSQNPGAEFPRGDGYAIITVDPAGTARAAGSVADGHAFTRATAISRTGAMPLYVSLYGEKGALIGWLNFRTLAGSDVDGTCHWSRPARPEANFYPQPLQTDIAAVGARYTPPAVRVAASAPVDPLNAELMLGHGNLESEVVQPVSIFSDRGIFLGAPLVAPGLSVALKPATGRFVGSFIHPLTQARIAFRGVMFQRENSGYGFFLGVDESGFVRITPKL